MGSWRQLQAVSRDPDAGEHRERGNQWVSTKEFGEEFHGSAVIEAAPAEAGAVDCSAGGLISPLLLPCLSRLGFVWLSARRHQALRHSVSPTFEATVLARVADQSLQQPLHEVESRWQHQARDLMTGQS